jgi:tetratricopeptide (TPR) repeat protein
VEQALESLRKQPQSSISLALQAIIAVAQNRRRDALELARAAVERAESVTSHIALSYAQQADFRIEDAYKSARRAVELAPRSVYALVRQAELQLALGEPGAALNAARQAADLRPETARPHTVLGFVYLVQLDSQRAEIEFKAAIALNQSDPLPRLGLGLARIRHGRLVDGREQLEVAVSLDPGNSLIRSYLGKAYFEERMYPEAAAQYELAKQADPDDPTPWFYGAVLAQALNQPGKAYKSLRNAEALNDNRLVYRSRLLADSDAAAQTVGLARIYAELGFEQLAINQSERSLFRNPTNHAGHRFLADALAGRERHELARKSVLFRSTLLQPLTINPAQPEAQETDLLILPGSGPTHASDNEFNPLFESDGYRVNTSFIFGNQNTLGDQFVLAAQRGRVAYSAAQFHYESDGFRENNDITHDLGNILFHYQLNPKVDLQVDVQARETESGAVQQSFDPNDFDPDQRINVQTFVPRIGIRLSPTSRTTVLASLRAPEREEVGRELLLTSFGEFVEAARLESNGIQPHLQIVHRGQRANQTIGIEGYQLRTHTFGGLELNGQPCESEFGDCTFDSGRETTRLLSSYYQADFTTNKILDWSIGLTYASADDDGGVQNLQEANPKFGLRMALTPRIDFRLASIGGVGRGGGSDVTLEPVVVAGFNQLFDDFLGTRYRNHSAALDWQISETVNLGVESTYRELKVPRTLFDIAAEEILVEDEAQDELTVRSYAYWLPTEQTALSASLFYERFEREILDGELLETNYVLLPGKTETFTLPISIRHALPNGFFAQSTITPVAQEVKLSPEIEFEKNSDWFINVDIGLGFKFDAINGSLRFDIKNVFDTDFLFQDQSFRSADRVSTPRFSAERRMYMRLSVSF